MVAAMQREELNRYLDGLLEVSRFRDYCPNGLQVEGRGELCRVVSGVTASIELIQAALANGADAMTGPQPLVIGDRAKEIRAIAWYKGAAQGFFEEAIN